MPDGLPSQVTTRAVEGRDSTFLRLLYEDVRRHEVGDWPEPLKQQFLDQQFEAQKRGYLSEYPDADHRLILEHGEPAGRLLVDRNDGVIHIIDIAVVSTHRGRGLGTSILETLKSEACSQGLRLRLRVLQSNNDAIRLYERLGFTQTSVEAMHFVFECCPSADSAR